MADGKDDGGLIVPAPTKNVPKGRTLAEFRDPETGLLWPAEEKLVAAARAGEVCDLSPRGYDKGEFTPEGKRTNDMQQALRDARTDIAFHALAAEVMERRSTAEYLWQPDVLPDDVKARVAAQPKILQEYFEELPSFSLRHSKLPAAYVKRLGADAAKAGSNKSGPQRDWATAGKEWQPLLDQLFARFNREAFAWRKVDLSDSAVKVRADVLRVLALGGDDTAPVHERGVLLGGAHVVGALDLTGARNVVRLSCVRSNFAEHLLLRDARLRHLALSGSRIPGMEATGTKFDGSIFLDQAFRCDGTVTLEGAEIDGNITFTGATLRNRSNDGQDAALSADGAKIGGSIHLHIFTAEGCVSISSVEIGGSLECSEANFRNCTSDGSGVALHAQRAKIARNVFFTKEFLAEGRVWLFGAQIGGSLYCRSGTFDNLSPSRTDKTAAADAIVLSSVRIGSALWLAHDDSWSDGPANIKGSIDLAGAHAQLLIDEAKGWPKRHVYAPNGTKLRCDIALDNFTYDRLAGFAPTDSRSRLAWLQQMAPDHLKHDYRPQPFAQIAKVLTEMGHADEAKAIRRQADRYHRDARWARRKKRIHDAGGFWMRKAQWFAEIPTAVGLAVGGLILDRLLGGGRSITAPLLTAIVMLAGCAIYYERAAEDNGFVPRDAAVWTSPAVRQACAGTAAPPPANATIDWYRCQLYPRELPKFYPLTYSADLMLPLINIGQKVHWRPRDAVVTEVIEGGRTIERAHWTVLEVVTWLQAVLSIALYVLLAALAAGWIKRD